jgi:hypothetical protein
MAFLDNSGDIILDAVLTDTGRARLAKGDGSFRIVKFAFGDDEIDYSTYKNSNHADGAHTSGSAYYDLEILQTPILEAFTNNTSLLKSKLISVPRTNLLYLPVLKLQKVADDDGGAAWNTSKKTFIVLSDTDTINAFAAVSTYSNAENGTINGKTGAGAKVVLHQGLDTTEISHLFSVDNDLLETQYIIEMDNRLGKIVSTNGSSATLSFIDDDNVASYFLSAGTNEAFIKQPAVLRDDTNTGKDTQYPIAGPQGTRLEFSVKSSIELKSSTYLFTKLGNTATGDSLVGTTSKFTDNYRYIDTNIRVTGATTGYRIDIPARFIRKV